MLDPASTEAVSAVLRKVLPEGRLNRIPRHPEHRNIVLAIFCLGLHRRYQYTETELNEFLKEQLDHMCSTVDHVTCRRYLVDLGFVKRDRAGKRYFLNFPRVELKMLCMLDGGAPMCPDTPACTTAAPLSPAAELKC
ncbi:MAG: DUF2087 domain-containing protein [Gammaproteobacteria bacterium]|nr:MAG: DUF2087 domain-containing protein [Gammaproteobacteria bacterium]